MPIQFPISKIFFGKITHCHSVLPYNINWRRSDWREFAPFFANYPIHVVDIGARDGAPEELKGLEPFLSYVAFDADAREAERLSGAPHPYRSLKVMPVFIGSEKGKKSFFLYKNLGESSSLRPNPLYTQFYRDLSIDREVLVDSSSLDDLLAEGQIADVDFLKLDTQGTEFEILEHADRVLQSTLLVETEVEFVELYQGQKLAFDIERLMHDKGFELLYINRVFLSRRSYEGKSRGQLIFGDMVFGVNEERAKALPFHKKAIYLALLLQYGHMDFAYALYAQSPELQSAFPKLRSSFQLKLTFGAQMSRLIFMQMDKVIAFLLHLRRTNGLRSDTDRNWPAR